MIAFFKAIGIAMIFTGSTLMGIVISSSYTKRVRELLDIKSFLTMCETSMNDIGMHTYEILQQSQSYMKTGLKDFLESVCTRLNSDYPELLATIWAEQIKVHQLKMSLTEQDLNVLSDIGTFLGSTGMENQKKQIQRISSMIDKHMEDAISLKNKNRKIALNMGVLGGLIIVLILL
ncbi:MAG TPA: hypothetical protein DDZ89_18625 [Clostridiales bacterium]|nr:hypothetical protein [Clostridiales bacterium]